MACLGQVMLAQPTQQCCSAGSSPLVMRWAAPSHTGAEHPQIAPTSVRLPSRALFGPFSVSARRPLIWVRNSLDFPTASACANQHVTAPPGSDCRLTSRGPRQVIPHCGGCGAWVPTVATATGSGALCLRPAPRSGAPLRGGGGVAVELAGRAVCTATLSLGRAAAGSTACRHGQRSHCILALTLALRVHWPCVHRNTTIPA